MLIWIFGSLQSQKLFLNEDRRISGFIELERAQVKWMLSIAYEDLPQSSIDQGHHTYRTLKMDNEYFDFSSGFDDLHTKVYADILNGGGYGIEDARPAVELVHQLRNLEIKTLDDSAHPLLLKKT